MTNRPMNGAESLVHTLLGGGADVCFANPGTSEMHFVAALDRAPGMRCILGLFEGVVTGAADGYARMAEKPAVTLLHLGPGLANGLANLHNAKKAATPMVNIVGDHATYHRSLDAPLTSDIETAARPFSHWVKTSAGAHSAAADAAAALTAARTPPGQIATLILPADTAWNEAKGPAKAAEAPAPARIDARAIAQAAAVLRSGEPTLMLLSGPAVRERGLDLTGRIAAKTGASLSAATFNARMARGAGRVPVERLPYPVDLALAALAKFRHVILVDAKTPVAFFAYPGKPSLLAPKDAQIHTLTEPGHDTLHALEWLADELGAQKTAPIRSRLAPPAPGAGAVTPDALADSIAALLPDGAIVIDESITTGRRFFKPSHTARPHDWLQNMGGSIGIGLPLAAGAAVACPDRKVICLQADGSGMYTLQALWTLAREELDVTVLVFANRSYAILKGELVNVGAQDAGPKALSMLDLSRPDLDWVSLARGMGVPAVRAENMDAFNRAFAARLAAPGPYLIEIVC
jgi:acetolactate synthase I/II/III large subunit